MNDEILIELGTISEETKGVLFVGSESIQQPNRKDAP